MESGLVSDDICYTPSPNSVTSFIMEDEMSELKYVNEKKMCEYISKENLLQLEIAHQLKRIADVLEKKEVQRTQVSVDKLML